MKDQMAPDGARLMCRTLRPTTGILEVLASGYLGTGGLLPNVSAAMCVSPLSSADAAVGKHRMSRVSRCRGDCDAQIGLLTRDDNGSGGSGARSWAA